MDTNPLTLIPAKARRVVLLVAMIVGVGGPIAVPELDGWAYTVTLIVMAVMALFSNTQSLSNLTPDDENYAIQQARHAIDSTPHHTN